MLKSKSRREVSLEVLSKLVEIEATLPVDNNFIEAKLADKNIIPLRWAIVKVNENKLTISLAYENL